MDCYILKLNPNIFIPDHKDPSLKGYAHYRSNFIIKSGGSYGFEKPSNPRLFRPDKVLHNFKNNSNITYMLSIGKLIKIK